MGNGNDGILVSTSIFNIMGGVDTNAHKHNIVSGNDRIGILVGFSENNTIQGNFIGIDITGNADLGNTSDGIYLIILRLIRSGETHSSN